MQMSRILMMMLFSMAQAQECQPIKEFTVPELDYQSENIIIVSNINQIFNCQGALKSC